MSFGSFNKIGTNMGSLRARYSLNVVNSKLSKVRNMLATNSRISKASYDPAGFSIASHLQSKIGALQQAQRNAGNGLSMLSVAEAGMRSINDILTTMKSKAVQGANGNMGSDERKYIAKQINEMMNQIDDIVASTTFGGTKLLAGGSVQKTGITFQVGPTNSSANQITVKIDGLNATQGGAEGLGLTKLATTPTHDQFRTFLSSVGGAIDDIAQDMNQLGIDEMKLQNREQSLGQKIVANKGALSSIKDVDVAKLTSKSILLQIQQQAAISAVAQANAAPQALLQFMRG